MATLGVRIRDPHLDIRAMRQLTQLAERHGYDSVWLPESPGHEVFTELTALVLGSERIRGWWSKPAGNDWPAMAR